MNEYRFCVAPMMDWTDRHCRFFHRLLTRHALLYTEMVTRGAVLHGDRARLLGFDPAEHPVALQLGGCEPAALAEAARIGEDFGYDEINLNVGCPSDRVQEGRVRRLPDARAGAGRRLRGGDESARVAVPVTVKCRIGVDEQDPRGALARFRRDGRSRPAPMRSSCMRARPGSKACRRRKTARCRRSIMRASIALKARASGLPIVINGGIASAEEARSASGDVDGVMMGRAAYQEPGGSSRRRSVLFGESASFASARAALDAYLPYIRVQLDQGVPLSAMARHLLGLFAGRPGARAYRRVLAMEAVKPGANVRMIGRALAEIDRASERLALAA